MSAANINRVVITGNLTKDPDRHAIRGGDGPQVCEMRIAVNGRRKDGDGWVDRPNYFDVVAWGALGRLCEEFLSRGRGVAIDGRLDWREWEGKDDKHHEAVTIVAENVHFLPRSAASQAKEHTAEETGEQAPPASDAPADTAGLGTAEAVAVGAAGSSDDAIPF